MSSGTDDIGEWTLGKFPEKEEMKPREFWIEFGGDPSNDKEVYKRYCASAQFKPGSFSDEVIHVIEYSAYEALKNKYNDLDIGAITTSEKLCSMAKQNNIMRKALEKIYHLDLSAGEQMWDIAEAIVGRSEPPTGHVKSNECYRKECDGNHVEAEDEKATLPIDVMSTANLTGGSGNGTAK